MDIYEESVNSVIENLRITISLYVTNIIINVLLNSSIINMYLLSIILFISSLLISLIMGKTGNLTYLLGLVFTTFIFGIVYLSINPDYVIYGVSLKNTFKPWPYIIQIIIWIMTYLIYK